MATRSTETLTRVGNDIRHFDANKCPPGFINWNTSYMVSIHSDCPTLFIVGTPKGGTMSMLEYVSMYRDFEGACYLRTEKFGGKGELNFFENVVAIWHEINIRSTFQLVLLLVSQVHGICRSVKFPSCFGSVVGKLKLWCCYGTLCIESYPIMSWKKCEDSIRVFRLMTILAFILTSTRIVTATRPQFHIRNVNGINSAVCLEIQIWIILPSSNELVMQFSSRKHYNHPEWRILLQ